MAIFSAHSLCRSFFLSSFFVGISSAPFGYFPLELFYHIILYLGRFGFGWRLPFIRSIQTFEFIFNAFSSCCYSSYQTICPYDRQQNFMPVEKWERGFIYFHWRKNSLPDIFAPGSTSGLLLKFLYLLLCILLYCSVCS